MKLSDHKAFIGYIALAIPFLAMLLMIAASAGRMNHAEFRIGIEGADPRDLLRGHYMVFNYRWPDGASNICTDAQTCCVCLSGEAANPSVSFAACHELEKGGACRGMVEVTKSWNGHYQPRAGLRQYYIPEEHAHDLDTMLRSNKERFKVGLVPQSSHDGQVKMMYVDDKPLPEFLSQPPR